MKATTVIQNNLHRQPVPHFGTLLNSTLLLTHSDQLKFHNALGLRRQPE